MALSRVALVVVGGFAIAEIALLAWVSQAIGLGWTLAILLAGAVVGGLIWRHEGNKAWASLREAQADPERATARVSDTALVFTGGLLFLPAGPPRRPGGVRGHHPALPRPGRPAARPDAARHRGGGRNGRRADASAAEPAASR